MTLTGNSAFAVSMPVQRAQSHRISIGKRPSYSVHVFAESKRRSKQSCVRHFFLNTASPSSSSSSPETPSGEEQERSKSTDSGAKGPTSTGNECPYCHDKNIVICPVCEGRGYLGRTITCYYCRGAKDIECPLCIDDIYKLSYVRPQNPTYIEEDDDDAEDEEARDSTDSEKINSTEAA